MNQNLTEADYIALRLLDQEIDTWRAKPSDDDVVKKAFAQGRKDLRRVWNLFRKGKFAECHRKIQSMDQLIQVFIPDRIIERSKAAQTNEP